MQWNQPPGNAYGFQDYPRTVLTNPQIIGEGDVAAITLPDGSMQFYFIPTGRHNQSPYFCNMKFPWSNLLLSEIWYIRRIIHAQANANTLIPTGYFNNQLPNSFGECPPSAPLFTSNYGLPEYYQKFHNDAWTSTTDIHYFYPSLRREICIKYCTETQTDIAFQNNVCNKPCLCKSGTRLREKKCVDIECACNPEAHTDSSVSCMSIDSIKSETNRQKSKTHKRRATKNKKISKRNHTCECKLNIKDTSNKFVTTFTDQASGHIPKNGRETQTNNRSNKKNTKTEIWGPIKLKSPKSHSTLIGSCESCRHSEISTCIGTSDTEYG